MLTHFVKLAGLAAILAGIALMGARAAPPMGDALPISPVVIGPRGGDPAPDAQHHGGFTLSEFDALVTGADEWAQLRRYRPSVMFADLRFNIASDIDVARWMPDLRRQHLPLELEVGVIKVWSRSGAQSFAKDSKVWNRLIADGATVDSIAMDDPLGAAVRIDPPVAIDDALDEIANFVSLAHRYYPAMKVGLINPYPRFTADQAIQYIGALQDRLHRRGERGLDFYRVDPNWFGFANRDYPGTWQGVRQIEDYCHQIHLPFSLIYWASNYPHDLRQNGFVPDDHFWADGLMREGAGYAAAGIRPDQFVIESWVGAPQRTVPDSDPLTLTGSALSLLRAYDK